MGTLKRSAVLCVAALFCWLVAPGMADARKKANPGGNQVRRATDHAVETAVLSAAGPSVTMTGISTDHIGGNHAPWPGSGTAEDPFIVTFHPHEEHLSMYMWKNDAMLNFHGTINDPDDQIQKVCLSLIEMPEEANQSYGMRDHLADMSCGVAAGDGNRVQTTEGDFECLRCTRLDFVRPVPGDYVAEWGLRLVADQDEIVPTGETVHFRIPELEITVTGIETVLQGSGSDIEGILWPGAGTADDPFIADTSRRKLNFRGTIYDPINRVKCVGLNTPELPEGVYSDPFTLGDPNGPRMQRPSQDEFESTGGSMTSPPPGDYVVEVLIRQVQSDPSHIFVPTGQTLHIRVPEEGLQQEEAPESVRQNARNTTPRKGRR